MKLENKVAVITGGNSGIGLATAREFKANGAKVVIFGRDRRTLEPAAADLGGDALAIQGDVRKLIPMRRRGTAEEMAKAMLFMASDDSSYCVGSELMADGGMTQLVNPA